MKKLLIYLSLIAAITTEPVFANPGFTTWKATQPSLKAIAGTASCFAGKFGPYTKNLHTRFSTKAMPVTKATPTNYKRFFTYKALATTGIVIGAGAAASSTGWALGALFYAYNNPKEFIEREVGIEASYKALDCINKRSWLTNYYAKNITRLDHPTFNEIIKQDPEAIHILTLAAAQHIDKVDWRILETIIKKNPPAIHILTQAAAQHIDKMHWFILETIINKNLQAVQIFTPAAAQHIDKMSWYMLETIINKNPQAVQVFTQAAAQHIAQMDPNVLQEIMIQNPRAKQIFTEALDAFIKDLKNESESLNKLMIFAKYKIITGKDIPKTVFQNDSSSQTTSHFATNYPTIMQQFGKTLLSNPEAVTFLEKIFNQEKKEIAEDRYIFYHACKWDGDFTQDLYTHLLYTLHDKPIPPYRFLRFNKDPLTTTYKDSKELNTRNELLLQGAKTSNGQNKKLLFLNHALFGNVKEQGSCTLEYWFTNRGGNYHYVKKTSEDIFSKLNQPDLYKKYQKDVEYLEKLHAQAENNGTFLLLSFSPEFLEQTIYSAEPGGFLKHVTIDNQKTRNVATILETLKKSPQKLGESSDRIEYCLVLTKDRALNPEYAGKDIKIYPFNMAKPKEYNEYCAKRDELMAKIHTDLKQEKSFITTDIFWLL